MRATSPQAAPNTTTETHSFHINEMLCFIQNKMERMRIDNVHTVCANFYSADEITAGKQLLYQTTTNIRGRIHKYVKRTGDNRNTEDRQDITHLLRVLGTSYTPVFLAQNLDNIPPTHPFDYNSELKRDIDLIKSHMENFTQNISMKAKTK